MSMMSPKEVPVLVWRAVTRACPKCGGRGVFASYFKYKERCPTCGIHLERGEPGYVVGTYLFNIITSELLFAAMMISWVLSTWPEVPWERVQYVGVGMMLSIPIIFYPFAKGLFLAFHLYFVPVGDTDR